MRIEPFRVSYEKRTVLDFSGVELEAGKIYAVIGANGSGKSTFAKGIAGIISNDEKKQIIDKKLSAGYMAQKSYAFRMSVEKNILLAGSDKQQAEYLMKHLQIDHLAKKNASRLSGGETARMALARIMMKEYDVLILDEPTAAMDMESTSLAEELILKYRKEKNSTIILITHSLQQARRVADEVLYFYQGKLIEKGEKEQVLIMPENEETKKFLEFYGV